MQNTKILIKTKTKSYPMYFGDGILSSLNKLVKKDLPNVKKICIVSDKKIPQKFLKKLRKSLKKYNIVFYKFSVNERIKDLKIAQKIIENILKHNFNRSDCIIGLGGGVIGDLSAFVASLAKRGMKFINIPTTLLSQVDASIGGKTAVNSIQGKNLIGTFYQPDLVLTDISFLDSLNKREMICGYGEILKHSLILDKNFFLWLNKNGKKIINDKNKNILKTAIIKSCKIKSSIVKKDESEKNLRMILNFGHTFAHGFEGAKKYSSELNHGEAVLLGMMYAIKFSYKRKLLPLKDLILVEKHYKNLNLPFNLSKFFYKSEINKIVSYMKKDKKNLNKKINLVLLKNIGKIAKINNFSVKEKILKGFLTSQYK